MLDKESEELESVAVPLAGLADLNSQAQEQVSSVAGIPLSIYLQVTPSGLDSSTQDEIRSFYAAVKARQERLFRPNLKTLLDYVQLSLFGTIDQSIKFAFVDLWKMSAQERATIRKADADADKLLIDSGVISNEEVRERMNGDEDGLYLGKLTGAAPEPEEPDDDPDPS